MKAKTVPPYTALHLTGTGEFDWSKTLTADWSAR